MCNFLLHVLYYHSFKKSITIYGINFVIYVSKVSYYSIFLSASCKKEHKNKNKDYKYV